MRPVDLPVTLDTEADHSLPSADDGSSGYESFALKEGGRGSESGGDCDSPCGSDHDSPSKSQPSPTLYDTGINTARTIGQSPGKCLRERKKCLF